MAYDVLVLVSLMKLETIHLRHWFFLSFVSFSFLSQQKADLPFHSFTSAKGMEGVEEMNYTLWLFSFAVLLFVYSFRFLSLTSLSVLSVLLCSFLEGGEINRPSLFCRQ